MNILIADSNNLCDITKYFSYNSGVFFNNGEKFYRAIPNSVSRRQSVEIKESLLLEDMDYIMDNDGKYSGNPKIFTAEILKKSEYVSIFRYLFDKGFRLESKMAEALFESYILKIVFCKNIEDYWTLYNAVCETVRFSQKIELWDSNYRIYDGLREKLIFELNSLGVDKIWYS